MLGVRWTSISATDTWYHSVCGHFEAVGITKLFHSKGTIRYHHTAHLGKIVQTGSLWKSVQRVRVIGKLLKVKNRLEPHQTMQ